MQKVDSIVDEGVVEQYPNSLEEVPSMPGDFLTSIGVVSSKSLKDFVMIEPSSFVSDFDIRDLPPGADDLILIFIVADGNWVMDDISNWVD